MRGSLTAIVALSVAGAADARVSVIQAGGAWAAIDRGGVCEALARSVRIAAKGKVQATAGFSFTPDHRRWGEFHARLSREVRANSSVMLTAANQQFLLVSRGGWAWSRGGLQEQAILNAVRSATGMRIDARDSAGRRFRDAYALNGAPTAIDAAAARCAGKMQRR